MSLLVVKSYIYEMLAWSIELYTWMMIVYIVSSFFVRNRGVGWYSFLEDMVEPPFVYLRLLTRNKLVIDRLDLTPLLLFLILKVIKNILPYLFF